MNKKETQKKTKTKVEKENGGLGSDVLRRRLLLGGILVLSILGLFALIQVYINLSSTITTWISQEYLGIFQAGFNLIILLLVAIAITRLIKKYKTYTEK